MRAKEMAGRLTPVQRYALLLARANDSETIRGKIWFQKEMFLLSKTIPELASELGFEPSLKGAMSDALDWDLTQLEALDLLDREGPGFGLTEAGKEISDALEEEIGRPILERVRDAKSLINDLPKEEMLALVYAIDPAMTTESEERAGIEPKRKDLAVSLFRRGKVGLERGAEVAGLSVQGFAALLRRRGVPRFST